jgi:hypothetical protein
MQVELRLWREYMGRSWPHIKTTGGITLAGHLAGKNIRVC